MQRPEASTLQSLAELRFRSSPSIELRELRELEPGQREPFLQLESDPDFDGLFVPRPPLTINLQSVGRDTARLFRSLAAPSRLDPGRLGDAVDLVLDGFLEIESGGEFVFGADAFPLVCPPLAPLATATAAARLSRDALLHAQDLESTDAEELTSALYRYHRLPVTPFWSTSFATPDAVLAHLGADRGPLRSLLRDQWTATKDVRGPGWLYWFSNAQPRGKDDVTYKLYVSPRPQRIREVFGVFVSALSDLPAYAFKVGDGAAGLLRPDKLIAYFARRDELDDAAAVLLAHLAGCEAHGVPFTAQIGDTALLSWGMDPPENERPLQWLGAESWRSWLVQRLGAALSVAKLARRASALEPWRFAIERVRRAGIDVETWTPSPSLWSAA